MRFERSKEWWAAKAAAEPDGVTISAGVADHRCGTGRWWEQWPDDPPGNGCCEACEQHYAVTPATYGADCGMWRHAE